MARVIWKPTSSGGPAWVQIDPSGWTENDPDGIGTISVASGVITATCAATTQNYDPSDATGGTPATWRKPLGDVVGIAGLSWDAIQEVQVKFKVSSSPGAGTKLLVGLMLSPDPSAPPKPEGCWWCLRWPVAADPEVQVGGPSGVALSSSTADFVLGSARVWRDSAGSGHYIDEGVVGLATKAAPVPRRKTSGRRSICDSTITAGTTPYIAFVVGCIGGGLSSSVSAQLEAWVRVIKWS